MRARAQGVARRVVVVMLRKKESASAVVMCVCVCVCVCVGGDVMKRASGSKSKYLPRMRDKYEAFECSRDACD